MNTRSQIAGIVVVAILAGATLFLFNNGRGTQVRGFISPSDRALVARGSVIYTRHCAACHGANLEGQADWRKRLPNGKLPAPPHDPSGHTWHHPDAQLIDIIKNGLVPGRTAPDDYRSDMPAYGTVLADDDIIAVLAYIKSKWPRDVLELQKGVTLEREKR